MNSQGDFTANDYRYMAECLRLARFGLMSTHPNPRVGCVIVKHDEIIAKGWHERAGHAHAEIMALSQAGERARGADVYVSLEPCCFIGRTGACTQALIGAQVNHVTAAMLDPNPRVSGKGAQALISAGIPTRMGLLSEDAQRLNAGFCKRMRHGQPYVRVKLAMSLDGKTAYHDHRKQWISNAAARRDVHYWRARSSAILSTAQTVLQDDPMLNVRLAGFSSTQPILVLLDRGLRVPASAKCLQDSRQIFIYHHASVGPRNLENIEYHRTPLVHGALDLAYIFADLAQREINEVWVEAGPRLAGALFTSGLCDEFIVYQAPILLGDQAQSLLHLVQPRGLPHPSWRLLDQRFFGDNQRLIYQLGEVSCSQAS